MSFQAIATPERMKRATAEWSGYAGESVTLEVRGDTIYAYGSELACLRLYKRFSGTGRVEESKNLKTWFYAREG